MTALITTGLFLIVYWKFRNNYNGRLTTEFSYRFYDLRDSLRDLAISGKIDVADWRFQYLDTSISKTVGELNSLNLYTIFWLYRIHKGDDAMKEAAKKFQGSLHDHKQISIIHKEYMSLLTLYVINKHFGLKFVIERGLWAMIGSLKIVKRLRESFKKAISFIRFAPETSTGPDFAYNLRLH